MSWFYPVGKRPKSKKTCDRCDAKKPLSRVILTDPSGGMPNHETGVCEPCRRELKAFFDLMADAPPLTSCKDMGR